MDRGGQEQIDEYKDTGKIEKIKEKTGKMREMRKKRS